MNAFTNKPNTDHFVNTLRKNVGSSKSGQARAKSQNGKIPSIKPEVIVKNAFNTKPDISKITDGLVDGQTKTKNRNNGINTDTSAVTTSMHFLFSK